MPFEDTLELPKCLEDNFRVTKNQLLHIASFTIYIGLEYLKKHMLHVKIILKIHAKQK